MKYLKYFESEKLYKPVDEESDEYINILDKTIIKWGEKDILKIRNLIDFAIKKIKEDLKYTLFTNKYSEEYLFVSFHKDERAYITFHKDRDRIDDTTYRLEQYEDERFIGCKVNVSYPADPFIIDGWDGMEEFIKTLCRLNKPIKE